MLASSCHAGLPVLGTHACGCTVADHTLICVPVSLVACCCHAWHVLGFMRLYFISGLCCAYVQQRQPGLMSFLFSSPACRWLWLDSMLQSKLSWLGKT